MALRKPGGMQGRQGRNCVGPVVSAQQRDDVCFEHDIAAGILSLVNEVLARWCDKGGSGKNGARLFVDHHPESARALVEVDPDGSGIFWDFSTLTCLFTDAGIEPMRRG